jgi:hypothetical protein
VSAGINFHGQEFLSNMSEYSGYTSDFCSLAAMGSAATPAAPIAAPTALTGSLVFGGISAGSKALELAIYSNMSVSDSIFEGAKIALNARMDTLTYPYQKLGEFTFDETYQFFRHRNDWLMKWLPKN